MNIDRESVRQILTEDLDMRKVCSKMVPKKLAEEQKQRRVTIYQVHLEREDDILGRVITGDETCVYQYNPETKREIAQRKTAQNIPSVQMKSQNNVADFFMLEGLFIMNLYQLDKQSTKFGIWKFWKRCMKMLGGNDPNILLTTHGSCITTFSCSHGTIFEGVFSY